MKPYQNREWLEKAYQEHKYNTRIAKSIGVSTDTIEYWRKKFDIPREEGYKSHARKHVFNEAYFSSVDTEEKTYWLGFLMADGHINKEKNRMSISLKEDDKSHLDKFQEAIGSNYKTASKDVISKGHKSRISTLRINSARMCQDLYNWGVIPNKTGKESMPKLPSWLERHFLRGLFDGDGCVSIGRSDICDYQFYRFCLASASRNILESIIEHFKKELGVELRIYQTSNSNEFYNIQSNKIDANKKVLTYLYKDSSIHLNRKYELAQGIIDCSPVQQCAVKNAG